FRHALLQEAAYEGLLRARKRTWHQRIAEMLETEFAGSRDAAPEILATHYAASGSLFRAIELFQLAGRTAASRSANREAAPLFERALALLDDLPYGQKRDEMELSLRVALGPLLMGTRGPGAPEVQALYRRAMELCENVPEGPMHFTTYWGWWRSAPNFK